MPSGLQLSPDIMRHSWRVLMQKLIINLCGQMHVGAHVVWYIGRALWNTKRINSSAVELRLKRSAECLNVSMKAYSCLARETGLRVKELSCPHEKTRQSVPSNQAEVGTSITLGCGIRHGRRGLIAKWLQIQQSLKDQTCCDAPGANCSPRVRSPVWCILFESL